MTTRNLGVLDAYLAQAVFSGNDLAVDEKVKVYSVQGRNTNVANGNREDIWESGGFYTYLTTASVLTCVSGSAQDAPAGSGIKTIKIEGLDGNYQPAEEFLVMQGLTPVNSVNSYIRTHQIFAVNSDNPDPNTVFAGNLTVSAGATLQQTISAGDTVSRSIGRTIPDGYQGVITQGYAASEGGSEGDFALDFMVRREGNIFVTALSVNVKAGNDILFPFSPFLGRLPGRSDLKVTALSTSATADVKAHYLLMAVRDDVFNTLVNSV